MKWFKRSLIKIKRTFARVWSEKYPLYWHIIDLCFGLACGLAAAITWNGSIGEQIGFFFALTLFGYLFCLAFTYGIVRARHGWSKKV